MATLLIDESIRPISDFASGGEGPVRAAASRDGATILVDGDERMTAVLPDALYRELSDAAARLELIEALDVGEAEATAGRTVPQSEVAAWVRTPPAYLTPTRHHHWTAPSSRGQDRFAAAKRHVPNPSRDGYGAVQRQVARWPGVRPGSVPPSGILQASPLDARASRSRAALSALSPLDVRRSLRSPGSP